MNEPSTQNWLAVASYIHHISNFGTNQRTAVKSGKMYKPKFVESARTPHIEIIYKSWHLLYRERECVASLWMWISLASELVYIILINTILCSELIATKGSMKTFVRLWTRPFHAMMEVKKFAIPSSVMVCYQLLSPFLWQYKQDVSLFCH